MILNRRNFMKCVPVIFAGLVAGKELIGKKSNEYTKENLFKEINKLDPNWKFQNPKGARLLGYNASEEEWGMNSITCVVDSANCPYHDNITVEEYLQSTELYCYCTVTNTINPTGSL